MRSRAGALKPWAWTVRALDSSPLARIFTGTSLRVARPFSRSPSGVTSAPASNRASRSARLTGWVCVRNGSKGIDFFMCGPRSLRIRMWIGIWPPSAAGRSPLPERAPQPFWPRPDVLPVPDPSPRPIRFLRWREPSAGFSECSPISWPMPLLLDLHEVADLVQSAAQLRGVLALGRRADLAEPERAQRLARLRVGAVLRLVLGDLQRGHQAFASAAGS